MVEGFANAMARFLLLDGCDRNNATFDALGNFNMLTNMNPNAYAGGDSAAGSNCPFHKLPRANVGARHCGGVGRVEPQENRAPQPGSRSRMNNLLRASFMDEIPWSGARHRSFCTARASGSFGYSRRLRCSPLRRRERRGCSC